MEERTDIHRKLIKKVLEGRATSEEKKLLSETEAVKRRMRQQWEQSNGKEANNGIIVSISGRRKIISRN